MNDDDTSRRVEHLRALAREAWKKPGAVKRFVDLVVDQPGLSRDVTNYCMRCGEAFDEEHGPCSCKAP